MPPYATGRSKDSANVTKQAVRAALHKKMLRVGASHPILHVNSLFILLMSLLHIVDDFFFQFTLILYSAGLLLNMFVVLI